MATPIGRHAAHGLVLAGGLLLGTSTAHAVPSEIPAVLHIEVEAYDPSGAYTHYYATTPGTLNPDGTYSTGGNGSGYYDEFFAQWDMVIDPDPLIAGTINLTNLSGLTQTFVINLELPATPITGSTLIGGSVGLAEFFDQNLDGEVTFATVAGTPLYQARIDGVNLPMGALGAFSLSESGTPGVWGSLSQLSFGTPIPSATGPAVGSSIGIATTFSLSSGDRVNIPLRFEVAAPPVVVPEASSAWLFGLALAGAALLRRARLKLLSSG